MQAEGPLEPAQLRISDRDRHDVAEVLRSAAGEGRIDLAELDERLTAVFAAKTYADLVPITADLPTGGGLTLPARADVGSQPGHVIAGPSYQSSFALMSGTERRGAWQVGSHHTAAAMMGSVVLDLRQAVFTSRRVEINASAFWGSVEVIVNPSTVVSCEGSGIMGSFTEVNRKVEPTVTADSPVVQVRGLALMGR